MAWTSRSGAGDFLAKKPTQIGLYAGVTGAVRGARVDGAGRSAASSMQALQGCPVGEPEHLDARDLARSWPCRSGLGLPLELSKIPSAGVTASAWQLCSCPHAPGQSALAILGRAPRGAATFAEKLETSRVIPSRNCLSPALFVAGSCRSGGVAPVADMETSGPAAAGGRRDTDRDTNPTTLWNAAASAPCHRPVPKGHLDPEWAGGDAAGERANRQEEGRERSPSPSLARSGAPPVLVSGSRCTTPPPPRGMAGSVPPTPRPTPRKRLLDRVHTPPPAAMPRRRLVAGGMEAVSPAVAHCAAPASAGLDVSPARPGGEGAAGGGFGVLPAPYNPLCIGFFAKKPPSQHAASIEFPKCLSPPKPVGARRPVLAPAGHALSTFLSESDLDGPVQSRGREACDRSASPGN